jgi:hypothetical protein
MLQKLDTTQFRIWPPWQYTKAKHPQHSPKQTKHKCAQVEDVQLVWYRVQVAQKKVKRKSQ